MKIRIIALIVMSMAIQSLMAQKYVTKTGRIRFYSDTPMEKIEGVNQQVNSAFDLATGQMVFKVLMKSFGFEKALMQEHFNENYAESDKFPNAIFKGTVAGLQSIDFLKDGKHNVEVGGDLTIHGVTQKVKTTATLESRGGKIIGHAVFNVNPKDYGINIPTAVVKQIAETIEVTVDATYDKMN
ncbi:MAG TPA: YceI family protein [Bacteroidales bacterium]|nr:MAG: hypothetical protein A2X11_10675 [Bacteroidetes bacterium GWE2_42_24]OFY28142.1 MAG: hypothetical protein A2X09_00930 [Bacteroidetes bacterium GWF2_43_11]HAQ64539.1 YceI family protein [Bacteroidales bacterium]HBZ65524.1 YceI family protein [Bacteroidales bacterium]